MPGDEINIQEFARKVERICDFVIARLKNEGANDDSADFKVIYDLKEQAANIHMRRVKVTGELFTGLADYLKGV